MAPRSLLGLALTRRAQHCARERALAPVLTQRRGIAKSYLKKVDEAEKDWNRREIEINEGKREHVWDVINTRGLVKDTAPYATHPPLVPFPSHLSDKAPRLGARKLFARSSRTSVSLPTSASTPQPSPSTSAISSR